jgi:predicted flap endonuclease-1-like 5' DNA nuclease
MAVEASSEEVIETPQAAVEVSSEEVAVQETESSSVAEDDIIVIDGIGPKFKERLAGFGIHTFADLAALSDERIAEIEQEDAMTSLEEWHNWIDQAKARLA